jgi:group I intron endonuclease
MTGIYKIISPSGKIYIGQSVNIERRLKWHKKNTAKCNSKLANSFKKYGADNHLFEVIEECIIELLNERERYYQEHYDVVNKGLNLLMTKTNDRSGYASIEVRKKLSELRKGKKHSPERNLKNSLSKLGVKHSEERKEINRKAHLGLKQSQESIYKKRIKGLEINKNDDIRYACGKLILNTQTGIYYLGLVPACESANLKRSTLSHKLIGRLYNDTDFIRV